MVGAPDLPLSPAPGEDPLALAQAALARRDAATALRCAEARLRAVPGDPWGRVFKAGALHAGGQWERAEAELRDLLEAPAAGAVPPGPCAAALRVRASLRIDQERTGEALDDLLRAIALEPEDAELRQWACALLCELGRPAEAEAQLVALEPQRGGDPEFWSSLARIQVQSGNRGPAERAFRRALQLDPKRRLDLARFLVESGRIEEAVPHLEAVLRDDPAQPAALSGRLVTRLYEAEADPLQLASAFAQAGRALAAGLRPLDPAPCDWDPERPLRVAYLSPDFRDHSCAQFAEPVLRAHDRRRLHLTLYYDLRERSARTDAFEALADRWMQVDGLSDEALAARVREDRIDVLVDMAGHTGASRLRTLLRRPAPVQLSWLGWPFTAGLSCLDGRITDTRIDPPGNEAFGSEPLRRLDPTYLAWAPPPQGPAPAAGRRGRPFTFGSFNQLAKLNGQVVEAWAAILRRAPETRLLLKGWGASDPVQRERLHAQFAEAGVPARRIAFLEFARTPAAHLAQYHELDLALDPFPYNGVTTTLEALWMEVPVLTLEGRHSLARHGAAFLGHLGLPELVCPDLATYVQRAVDLAHHEQALAALRNGLRQRLLESPLGDAPALSRRLEGLYRSLWREACARARSGS